MKKILDIARDAEKMRKHYRLMGIHFGDTKEDNDSFRRVFFLNKKRRLENAKNKTNVQQ